MYRVAILVILALFSVLAVFSLPPVAQDPAYHDFADRRGWLGISNFGDVAGNLVFLAVGMAGLFYSWRDRDGLSFAPVWLVFFAGVFLTGLGSGYYHLAPSNGTLVWDRLPMTVAFMSLFSLLIAERVNEKAGRMLFPVLLVLGAASVWYWDWTESAGSGDLRPYALVQFFPMLAIVAILALYPAAHKGTKYILYTLGWYVAAKFLEHFDRDVFDLTGQTVSGHTLKHVAAALGTACMIGYMRSMREGKKA